MKENKVQNFLNENFGEVRAFVKEGNIWFVAKDICNILEIKNVSLAINGNPTRGDKGVGEKCKGIYNVNTLGGKQDLLCISEQGLYKLIFKSRKSFAEEFQDWICEVVIPAIRKDGGYINSEEEFAKGEVSEEEFILKAMTMLQNKVNRLKEENEIMKPKAEYHDTVLNKEGLLKVTDIAKDLGMSAVKLNKILKQEKIQYKKGDTWYLYSNYQNLITEGYCDYHINEYGQILKWTEKGRKFIIDLLKERTLTNN